MKRNFRTSIMAALLVLAVTGTSWAVGPDYGNTATHIAVPADLKAAAQAGVDAEIANIAMYTSFLARPKLTKAENTSVKSLFEQLMRASENHLRAFRTQLSRY